MSAGTRLLSIGSIASATIGGSLLHPFVTGQVHATTTAGGSIGTGLLPASMLFVAIALVLGLVAYRRHIPMVDRATSLSTSKRVATLTVATLVVSTAAIAGVGGPASPTGTASAQSISVNEACSGADLALTGITFGLADSFRSEADRCIRSATDQTNVSATDAYAWATGANASTDGFLVTQNNLAETAEPVARDVAMIAAVNAMKNNETEANASAAAKEAVTEFYLDRQRTLIEHANATVETYGYFANQTGQGRFDGQTLAQGSTVVRDDVNAGDAITLVDGNTTRTKELYDGTLSWSLGDEITASSSSFSFYIADPGSSDQANVVPFDRYETIYEEYDTQHNRVESNIDAFVTNVYANTSAENISQTADEILQNNPSLLASQAATDLNNTGYYGYSNAQLSALGMNSDLNQSHVVTLETTNRTVDGTLFYTGENQTFDTGTTYDPANLSGSTMLSVASMSKEGTTLNDSETPDFVSVSEPFTIESATNTQTGEAVNTTTMEARQYQEFNASTLSEELDRLQEQRDYYEQQATAAAAGSGGSNTMLIAAIALAAGAALMWRRDDD